MGNAYLEEGEFEKAFEYLNKSLMVSDVLFFKLKKPHNLPRFSVKNVKNEDEITVELLASTSMCYSSKWLIKKSEMFSILAIQVAKWVSLKFNNTWLAL